MSLKKGDVIVREDADYPVGALIVSGYGENGDLLAYSKGGVLEFKVPASEIERFTVANEEEKAPIYRKRHFAIDGINEKFAGWWDGETWNGWAKPAFESLEARRVVTAIDPKSGQYDSREDAFITVTSENEEETWPAEIITMADGGTIKVYAVGTGSLIWDEVEGGK